MEAFGLKNFKRFKELPLLPLNNITFVVGANNSGKSSYIKAMLLALYNLLNTKNINVNRNVFDLPLFMFDIDEISHTHVGTFGRAINHCVNEDSMEFSITFDDCTFSLTVSRTSNSINYFNRPMAPITRVAIYNSLIDTLFEYDLENLQYTVSFNAFGKGIDKLFFKENLETMEKRWNLLYDSNKDRSWIGNNVFLLENRIKLFKEILEIQDGSLSKIVGTFSSYNDGIIANIATFLSTIIYSTGSDNNCIVKDGDIDEIFGQSGHSIVPLLQFATEQVNIYVKKEPVFDYIYAHTPKRTSSYNIHDRNDYIADTIHKYVLSDILDPSFEYDFVIRWLKKFKIGDSFRFESEDGEIYKVYIISEKDGAKTEELLSDKGVGSIHLVELIFRLATLMRKHKSRNVAPIIFVEEPEQNLHPNAQALLTDLFSDVVSLTRKNDTETDSNSNAFQFVIETHSEYMIRHAQVEIAKANFSSEEELMEKNIYSVLYFPIGEEEPYDVGFKTNGMLKRPFMNGFYDVASGSYMELLKANKT